MNEDLNKDEERTKKPKTMTFVNKINLCFNVEKFCIWVSTFIMLNVS